MKNSNILEKIKKIISFIIVMSMFVCLFDVKEVKAETSSNTGADLQFLYIGNSKTYYNNFPGMYKNLSKATGKGDANFRAVLAASRTLEEHATKLESIHNDNGGINEYEQANEYVQGKNSSWSLLEDEYKAYSSAFSYKWDYIVLQEQTANAKNESVMLNSSQRIIDVLKKYGVNSDFKIVYNAIWAKYPDPTSTSYDTYEKQMKQLNEEQTKINKTNKAVADKTGGIVSYSGQAFYNYLSQYKKSSEPYYSEIYNSDRNHPNQVGTYLSACCLYSAINSVSPVGINYLGSVSDDANNPIINLKYPINDSHNDATTFTGRKNLDNLDSESANKAQNIAVLTMVNNMPKIDSLVSSNTSLTNENIVLTVNASKTAFDLDENAYSWDNQKTWTASNTMEVQENGIYTVFVRDNIGHIASKNIEVVNIDKNPKMELDSHSFTNKKPGTTVQVKATKINTTDKIQWSSSDETVAKVNSNIIYNGDTEEIVTIECLKAGNATITAKLTDSISDTVTIEVKEDEQKPTLTLTSNVVNIEEGTTQNISAQVSNGNGTEKITWVSANVNIATVEASSDGKTGTIKGINAGTTTVNVYIDGEKAGEIGVTVNAKKNPIDPIDPVEPTVTITITNSMTIKKGNTAKVNATVTGTTSSITWTSSNDKVATVDQNGVVTGEGVGTAVIIAEVEGKTATCNVTVEDNKNDDTEDKTNVVLETVSMTLYKGATKEIKAEVSNGTSSITWTSSNDKVATVDENGVVTAVGVGTAYITATLENGNSAVCTVNVIEREDNNNNNNNNNNSNNNANNNNKGNTTTNQLPTNVVDNTMAINKILPKTGISRIIIAVITIIVISQVVLFVKYRRYKDI